MSTLVVRKAENDEILLETNVLQLFTQASAMSSTNPLKMKMQSQDAAPLIKKDTGRIVVTASGVHDPDSPGGAQGKLASLGGLEGFENAVAAGSRQFDMVDGGEFNADKAYKDSKLTNVLFTRELQRRLRNSGSNIQVSCFNPGLIVGTGLFRDQNQVFTKVLPYFTLPYLTMAGWFIRA